MNGFLARLAQRSLGVATVVSPRLPSMFEPLAASAENVPSTATPTSDLPAVAGMTQAALSPQQGNLASADIDDAPPRRRTVYADGNKHGPIHQRDAAGPTPESVPDHTADDGDHALAAATGRHAHPSLAAEEHAVTVRARSVYDSLPLPPLRSDEKYAHRPPPHASALLLPTRPAPAERRHGAMAVALDPVVPPSAVAPTIHISIGRVDVRANITPPLAAACPRTERDTTQPLADYLKRGRGNS